MDNKFINKFIKGSAFSSIGTLVTILVHFLSIKVLASMSPDAFGTYSYIIVISHGFQILSGLGLNLTLVKHLAGEEDQLDRKVISGIFFARFCQLLLISSVVYSAGHLFLPALFKESQSLEQFIVFIPIIFCLASMRDLLFHLLQGLQKFNGYAYINIFSALVKLGSILAFYSLEQLTVANLIWVEIITYGSSLAVLLIYAPLLKFFTLHIDRSAFKQIFGFGLPLYANDILTYIYNRVSVLLIGGLLSSASVAMYEMANKVPDGFGRLFSSLIVVYFPSLSELLNDGRRDEARKFMNKGLVLAAAGLSFAALFVFLFRREIVLVIAKPQYLDAALALALLMINFNLSSITRMMGYSIVAAGYSSVPVKINVVSSITNVAACLILIPRAGFIGAVYALLIMNTIAITLNYLFLVRADLKPDVVGFIKSLLFMALTIGGYTALGNEAIWVRAIANALYLALCWIFIPEVKQAIRYGIQQYGHKLWRTTGSV